MLELFARVLCLLLVSILIVGCGDVDPVDVPLTGEELIIVAVLKKSQLIIEESKAFEKFGLKFDLDQDYIACNLVKQF